MPALPPLPSPGYLKKPAGAISRFIWKFTGPSAERRVALLKRECEGRDVLSFE